MARRILTVSFQSGSGLQDNFVPVTQTVVAGWTGRDPAAVEKHIVELEALGIRRPVSTPIFYRVRVGIQNLHRWPRGRRHRASVRASVKYYNTDDQNVSASMD